MRDRKDYVRYFDDDVVRFREAYLKVWREMSSVSEEFLPEGQNEFVSFCRASTISLLIEWNKAFKDGYGVFDKPVENVMGVLNPHDKAGACSFLGKQLLEEGLVDPVEVIRERLEKKSLSKSSYKALMQMKDDYKVNMWENIDKETLACFIVAEEIVKIGGDLR